MIVSENQIIPDFMSKKTFVVQLCAFVSPGYLGGTTQAKQYVFFVLF